DLWRGYSDGGGRGAGRHPTSHHGGRLGRRAHSLHPELLSPGRGAGRGWRPRSRPSAPSQEGDGDILMREALINGRIVTRDRILTAPAVVVEDGWIADIVSDEDSSLKGLAVHDLEGALLLPGFIDTQVNG